MIFHSYKMTHSSFKNNDFFFPVTIFGSSWRMLSKCHLAFLPICLILSSLIIQKCSVQRALYVYLKPLKVLLIWCYWETPAFQGSSSGYTHPKPQKANRDGSNCTFPDTSSHSQPHKQIWESVCLHGWVWNMESEFPLHLWITWASLAPFCHQNTRSWCSGSFPLGVPSEHPTVTWLSKKIPSGHTDNCLGTFPILVCTAERTEQSNATSAELQLNSTKFCQRSHPAWA